MWKEILIRISEGDKNIKSPFDKNGKLEYMYVVGNKTERIGVLYFWCTETKKGGYFSRVKAPLNSNCILFEEAEQKLPEIKLIEIDFED